jgi:ABC-type uncharacterized transport system permease subunit
MKHTQKRKICDSWYHQRWFRILLVIVAIDMIVLGVTFALGLDVMNLLGDIHIVLRAIGGLAYVLVAVFVIHYSMSYSKLKKENFLVCQHCAHVESEKKS